MADTENEAIVRRGYDAFNAADAETLVVLLHEDVVHVNPGNNWSSGEHKGRDAVLGMYGRYGEETGGNYAAILESVEDQGGDKVLARHRVKSTRGDRTLDMGEEIIFTIRDGQIARLDVTAEDPAAEDAYWA